MGASSAVGRGRLAAHERRQCSTLLSWRFLTEGMRSATAANFLPCPTPQKFAKFAKFDECGAEDAESLPGVRTLSRAHRY
jgi:hypothetical protein